MKKKPARNTELVRRANGIRGFFIRSFNGEFFFRVYKKGGKFTDYEIAHCDLEVKICDSSASLYHLSKRRKVLDYSPEVLGYRKRR